MNYKYKVGDKVRVRKDLVEGNRYFMEGHHGNPIYGNSVVDDMMEMCGKVVTIKSQGACGYRIEEFNYSWTDEMLEDIANKQKIVITTDGKETLARLYEGEKVIKRAVAMCSPDDTFDFATGAKLAFNRLMGEAKETPENAKWRVVNRKPKVGDYIRLKTKVFSFNEIGDILKVDVVKYDDFVSVYGKNHNRDTGFRENDWNYIIGRHCEIVEPVNPEKVEFKPHLVSGKDHYGIIGEPTNYKDAIGRPLCIGDVVEVYDNGELIGEYSVVKSRLSYRNNKEKVFVMGIEGACNEKTGETGEYKILKKRSYEDIKHGDDINFILYVKESK